MGTCYSKSGHDAAEGNSKNQPISKESGRHQPNGSLYVYRPGKNHDTQTASASQSGNMGGQEKNEEGLKINTIDSGIESLTSSQCNKELKELAENSELREATDTFELIDNGPCACGENCEVNGQCKFECLSKLPESNVEWTSGHSRPLSQPSRKGIESSMPLIHRKPRCKGRIERKSSRLSWKSTDSLDWTRTMVTTMDRTTSQVSDIFVDDISLHAPLAHFDSIEFSGEDKDTDTNGTAKTGLKTVVAVTANTNEIAPSTCSATILISNDKQANVCEKPVESVEGINVQSTDRTSKDFNIENLEDIVKKQLSSQSLLGSREGENSSLAGSLLSFPPKSEVTSVVVDGKEVVLIDADTYSQVMDEIALLKTKLGQLTSVIQTESLNYCDPGSVQSAAWPTGTMDASYNYDRNSVVGTPDLLSGVEEQLLGDASSSVQPLPTDAPSSAGPLVADPPSTAEHQVADPVSTAEHQVEAPPSTVEPQVAAPPSTMEPKMAAPLSTAEPQVAAPPSTAEPQVAAPPSTAEPQVAAPPSTAEPKVAAPPSMAEPQVAAPPSTAEPKVAAPPSTVEPQVAAPPSTVEPQVAAPPSTVEPQVAAPPSTVEHQVAAPPSTVEHQVAAPPSTAEHQVAALPSKAEPQVADPSSLSENLPANISLLAEKLVAEVLPASAAQVAMMTPSSAETKKIESSPTEMLDPAPPESAKEPIKSLSAPISSEDQTVSADPSTKADNTSPNT